MVNPKLMLQKVYSKMKKPVEEKGLFAPSLGIFLGLFTSGFLSEMTARAVGKVGYYKAGIKSLVKSIFGLLLLGAGTGFPGTNVVMYPAALACFGSIPFDWIDARWPGGVYGMAEKAAVVIRTWSYGMDEVQKEIAEIEALTPSAPNTIIETRGEAHFPFENTHTKAELELMRLRALGRTDGLSKDHATPPEAMRAESPLDVTLTRR